MARQEIKIECTNTYKGDDIKSRRDAFLERWRIILDAQENIHTNRCRLQAEQSIR